MLHVWVALHGFMVFPIEMPNWNRIVPPLLVFLGSCWMHRRGLLLAVEAASDSPGTSWTPGTNSFTDESHHWKRTEHSSYSIGSSTKEIKDSSTTKQETTKSLSGGSNNNNNNPTRVSGYGSRHHRHPSTVKVVKTVVTITEAGQQTVEQQVQAIVEKPLYLHTSSSSTTASTLQLYAPIENELVEFGIDPKNQPERNNLLRLVHRPKVSTTTASTSSMMNHQWMPIESIFGMYEVPSGIVMVFVVDSELFYDAPLHIHRVKELYLTLLLCPGATQEDFHHHRHHRQQSSSVLLSKALQKEQERQLQLLREALKEHDWYYRKSSSTDNNGYTHFSSNSLIVDMTVSLQAASQRGSLITIPDSRFYWNEALLEPLLHHPNATTTNLLNDYSYRMVSAFCGKMTLMENNSGWLDEILISRRSKWRAGTRFTKRGADTTGAVANAVETEQILLHLTREKTKNATVDVIKTMSSFVQTRGSLPLFWSSPTDIKTYRPRVQIGTDPIAQARAVLAHIQDHTVRYVVATTGMNGTLTSNRSVADRHDSPSILMVNLIDKHSDQGRLGRAFDSVLSAVKDVFQLKHVEHVWFDFHANVKSGQWHRLLALLDQARPALDDHGFYSQGGYANKFKLQSGVVRTNCMDCLDRTNVVQSIFGRYILFQQLVETGVMTDETMIASFQFNPLELPQHEWEMAHRALWADNADAISRLYAGTPALKGDFTRTGKRTRKGALEDGVNSLQRYYQNNFLDADRQEGIDLLTGLRLFHGIDDEPRTIPSVDREKTRIFTEPGQNIRDAAIKLLSGNYDPARLLESNIRHERIKVADESNQKRKHLSLRWLPGDLQSHFRNLASLQKIDQLEALDNRSSTSNPWWIVPDSSDDESVECTNPLAANLALMFGALVVGSQSPLSLATLVLSIMATSLVRPGDDAFY